VPMSQNPEETPDRSAGQSRSGSTPESDPYAPPTPNHSGQGPYGDSGADASSTTPLGSQDSGSSTDPEGSAQGPSDSPDNGSNTSSPSSGSDSYGQSQYGQSQSGPSPYGESQYGQSQYGQPGFDPSAGQAGYPQYGQQADPNYGQGEHPPTQSQPYGQQAPGGFDPNAQYGAPGQAYPPQQFGQPGYPQYAGQAPVSESDEKLWGLLAHISIPFIGFIGPLIAYLIYKDRSPWLKDTSTEALNFSILYSIATVVSSILVPLLIGAILLPLVFIAGLIFCILAAVAANRHELYRYPINWRIIK
jgi:uncharacterized protein